MGHSVHTTAKERREWSCPSCGALIDVADRFQFLVEYQRYREAPSGELEDVGTKRPRFACRACQQLPELVAHKRPSGGLALWLAVALVPLMVGLFILGLIASWMAH